jgi:hypothetical protein
VSESDDQNELVGSSKGSGFDSKPQIKVHANYLSVYDATWSGYLGIVIWGGFYGALWPLIAFLIGFVISLTQGFPFMGPGELVFGVFWLSVTILFMGFIGMLLAGFVGLVTTLLVCLFNQSLGNIWTPITAIGIAGGFAGFTSALIMISPFGSLGQGGFSYILYLLGPGMATAFGQFGAIRMSVKQLRKHFERQNTKVHKLWQGEVRSDFRKFELKQMLILTGWFAGLFAIVTTVGRFRPIIAVAFATYFLIQIPIFYLIRAGLQGFIDRHLAPVLLNDAEQQTLRKGHQKANPASAQPQDSTPDPFDF